jgi:hypothetical protein
LFHNELAGITFAGAEARPVEMRTTAHGCETGKHENQ